MRMNPLQLLRTIFAILFIFFAFRYLPQVRFDNSLSRWVSKESSELVTYKEFLKDFGGDALYIISFYNPEGFDQENVWEQLRVFQQKIAALPHVKHIFRWPLPVLRSKKENNNEIYSIIVTYTPPSHLNPRRPELLEKIEERLSSIPLESHLAGTGVLSKAIDEESRKSTFLFLAVGLLILLGLLFLILKKSLPLLYTLGVSLGGVATLLIFSAALNIPLNLLSVILPVLVLFYCTSNSLHILFHKGNFKAVLKPCFLATITTGTGFAVFLIDPIPLLRDFALPAISGIFGGFLWSLFFFFPQTIVFKPRKIFINFFDRIRLPTGYLVFSIFFILLLLLIPGFTRIKTDNDTLSVISPANQRVKDHHFIEENVGNYIPLEYTVDIGKAKPRDLESWISAVYALPEVSGMLSFYNFPFSVDARKYGYATKNYERGRITFFIPLLSSKKWIALIDRIDAFTQEKLGDYRPQITGYMTLYNRFAQDIRQSFIRSLIMGFTFVFLIIRIYLRSLKLFIAAIIANLFPILVMLGMMGWLNISLDIVTVPIGCLLLSIIVDDSLHFLYWYKTTRGVTAAIKEAGPGILLTSSILVTGFSVFLLASTPPVRYFGILSIIALLTALAGDLILMPVILKIIDNKQD